MNDIISVDFIRSYFPDRSSDDLSALQTRVTRLIEEYLRTSFIETEYTEVYGTKAILVPYHLPITSVTSITDVVSSEALTADTDYVVDSESIQFPSRTEGTKDISVVYKAGLTNIPVLVGVVAEDIIRFWSFKDDKRDELFFSSETMEDRSYKSRRTDENQILSRLSKYRFEPLGSTNRGRQVRIGVL